jgi:hypothetical protein
MSVFWLFVPLIFLLWGPIPLLRTLETRPPTSPKTSTSRSLSTQELNPPSGLGLTMRLQIHQSEPPARMHQITKRVRSRYTFTPSFKWVIHSASTAGA